VGAGTDSAWLVAYKQSLLTTEIRILTEDDDNLVIAFRIPKATIRANHHFLGALSDSVSTAPNMPVLVGSAGKRVVASLLLAKVGAVLTHPVAMIVNWAVTIPGLFM
jgi:hypothetical protein